MTFISSAVPKGRKRSWKEFVFFCVPLQAHHHDQEAFLGASFVKEACFDKRYFQDICSGYS
jgi:hypothetical protein